MLNRLANVHNRYQGDRKKVLCACSAGLLRSPSIAFVLSNPPYDFNTRAVGTEAEYALIPIDVALVEWADEIICADKEHFETVQELLKDPLITDKNKPVYCFHLPDRYATRDPELISIIEGKANEIYGNKSTNTKETQVN